MSRLHFPSGSCPISAGNFVSQALPALRREARTSAYALSVPLVYLWLLFFLVSLLSKVWRGRGAGLLRHPGSRSTLLPSLSLFALLEGLLFSPGRFWKDLPVCDISSLLLCDKKVTTNINSIQATLIIFSFCVPNPILYAKIRQSPFLRSFQVISTGSRQKQCHLPRDCQAGFCYVKGNV